MQPIIDAVLVLLAAGLGWGAIYFRRRLARSERDRRRGADELNRRLSELFSLQELSYILSGSLQLDRIVEQVVRYAMRFLDAQGALVALAAEGEGAGSPSPGPRPRRGGGGWPSLPLPGPSPAPCHRGRGEARRAGGAGGRRGRSRPGGALPGPRADRARSEEHTAE